MDKMQIKERIGQLDDEFEDAITRAEQAARQTAANAQRKEREALADACAAGGGHIWKPQSFFSNQRVCFVCGAPEVTKAHTIATNLSKG